ncbi:MAG: glycosyltransferase, partial [Pseudomonadales bacterium]
PWLWYARRPFSNGPDQLGQLWPATNPLINMSLRTCFIIPTFNEARNITPLLQRLAALYKGEETCFLIVDDNSPDGTAALVTEFAATDPRVHLLTGERQGLGAAYVRGMNHALEQLGAEVVVQMDADFSHDPSDAARLLDRIAEGVDVAIGSRYVADGALDKRWGLTRRLLSRWGNRLARWIGGIKDVQDCTAGFKAIRASALREAQIDLIRGRGYVFQVELLHRLAHANAKIVEEPIYFRDREHGTTKLGFGSMVEFFYTVWWLRLAGYKTFIKFLITGATGVAVNLGAFQLLLELELNKFVASPLAIFISIQWNFLLNNFWTFRHREMYGRKRVRGIKYNLVSLLSLVVSYATFIALSLLLPAVSPMLAQACGIIPATIINYLLNSYWTFAVASATAPNSPADRAARPTRPGTNS